MGSYYYLMAQLPHLDLEQKPPMTSEAFISLAKTLMSKADAQLLDSISINFYDEEKTTGCKFVDAWREWERALRLNTAKQRAGKMHRNESQSKEPPYVPQDAVLTASKSVNSDCNPLEGELLIDKARWNAIDEFAGTDYFTRNHAYAYLLKLLILERRQSHDADKGFTEYKMLYDHIIEYNSPGEKLL